MVKRKLKENVVIFRNAEGVERRHNLGPSRVKSRELTKIIAANNAEGYGYFGVEVNIVYYTMSNEDFIKYGTRVEESEEKE